MIARASRVFSPRSRELELAGVNRLHAFLNARTPLISLRGPEHVEGRICGKSHEVHRQAVLYRGGTACEALRGPVSALRYAPGEAARLRSELLPTVAWMRLCVAVKRESEYIVSMCLPYCGSQANTLNA